MAQDFGDDMGNALLNFVTRQTENYLRFGRGRERAFDWWQRHYKKEGNTPEAAKAMAEKQSSREQVVVPFGTSEEAAYYAQVCRENGTYAAAYMDKQGNGFLAFAKEDAKTVAGYAPQFKDVMARLDEQRITDALNHAEPVNKKTMDSLTELTGYPDLPAEDVTVMLYTQKHLFQALTPKSDYNPHRHGFSIAQVKRFPELLASPVALANSPNRDDVLLAILLATDAYDTPLIAGIKPDGTGNYGGREVETNMVLSVYSRQNFIRYFALLRDMDAFVFVSGKKIEALEDLSGLPLAGNCSGLDIDRILQRPKCLG